MELKSLSCEEFIKFENQESIKVKKSPVDFADKGL